MPRVIRRNTVIAHHLVISGYGHWFANDPRGSGSGEIRDIKFEDLGPIHFGRKSRQPSRDAIKAFFQEAEARLDHQVLWFDESGRDLIGTTIGNVISGQGYTVWACAVLRDHVHLCVRIHRDDYRTIWEKITSAARGALSAAHPALVGHPIWADRPYSRYCTTVADVWRVVRYIEGNPKKHGLPAQAWDFVKQYDNWPENKKGRGLR